MMFRRAFGLVAVLCLLLVVAVAGLWVRSYLRWYTPWVEVGGRAGEIHVVDGVLVVFVHDSPAPGAGVRWIWRSSRANQVQFGEEGLTLYDAPENRHVPLVSWGRVGGSRFAGVPLALLIVPLLPAPIVWLRVRRRWSAAHRRKLGLCPACGYSLRGIASEACPECGTKV